MMSAAAGKMATFNGILSDSHSGPNKVKKFSREEAEANWEKALQSTDELMQNYKQSLIDYGVPDCDWLNKQMEQLRKDKLDHEAHLLAVARGTANADSLSVHPDPISTDIFTFCNQMATKFNQHCLDTTNPNFGTHPHWHNNCQRCVPAFEMLRRGENVTARPSTYGSNHLAYHPFDVWENPTVIHCTESGIDDIRREMSNWGDGARAQIVVYWNGAHRGGHTFIAEQKNGETLFYDPQTGKTDAAKYFAHVIPHTTQFCRIDNLNFSKHIEVCYQGVS